MKASLGEVSQAKKGIEQALAQRSEEAARMRAQLTRMADSCSDKDAQLQLYRGEIDTLRRDLKVRVSRWLCLSHV